jgi:hypothetical protein
MAGLGIQTRGTGIAKVQRQEFKKGGKAFPDLTGDGKVTRADVLKGRGVFKKGGEVKKESSTKKGILIIIGNKDKKPKEMKKGGQAKVGKVMREFGKGKLHSGKKGPVVKSRKQAVAIALSEAGISKKKK